MDFVKKVLNKLGKEIKIPCDPHDPTPIEVDPKLKRVETQDERIRRIIREQIRPQEHGYETEEDNEDLDVEDDENLLGDMPLTVEEMEYITSQHGDIIEEILKPIREENIEKEVVDDAKPSVEDTGESDQTGIADNAT